MVHVPITFSSFVLDAILPFSSPIPAATFFFCSCFLRVFLEAGILLLVSKLSCRSESSYLDENVMGTCTICKQQIRMIKANTQAKTHVDNKHSGKSFAECFPDSHEYKLVHHHD